MEEYGKEMEEFIISKVIERVFDPNVTDLSCHNLYFLTHRAVHTDIYIIR